MRLEAIDEESGVVIDKLPNAHAASVKEIIAFVDRCTREQIEVGQPDPTHRKGAQASGPGCG